MLPDFKLIQHKFPERPDIEIWPIADVHLGAFEHNAEKWAAFCDELVKRPNAYCVLGGDLVNNATRGSIGNGVFEDTMRPRQQKKVMVEMLRPLRDKVLCAVTGNHERRSGKDADDDATYDILCKLDLEHLYRENIAFVKIQMGAQDGAGKQNPTYIMTVTHGAGGGVLTGSAVNKAERFGYVLDGDILIVGHTHKPFVTQPMKIKIDTHNNKVSFKPFKVVSTTSWLDYGGYAAQKMLPPTSIAPQIIKLYGKRKHIEVTM